MEKPKKEFLKRQIIEPEDIPSTSKGMNKPAEKRSQIIELEDIPSTSKGINKSAEKGSEMIEVEDIPSTSKGINKPAEKRSPIIDVEDVPSTSKGMNKPAEKRSEIIEPEDIPSTSKWFNKPVEKSRQIIFLEDLPSTSMGIKKPAKKRGQKIELEDLPSTSKGINKPANKRTKQAEQEQVSESRENGNIPTVVSHYNQIREFIPDDRLRSPIFYMRNFNNWIKSRLINKYVTEIRRKQRPGEVVRVLDLCCGKGGDLLKWNKNNITHLICNDLAEISIQQCQQRYKEMMKKRQGKPFSAQFLSHDATSVRLRRYYKDPSLKLNLTSCQFALHYCFESFAQANCMIFNAAECLMENGYFIATIPNAYEIIRRLRSESQDNRSFGNDIYKIEFLCDTNPPPLFGAKYNFHLEGVVDCPEFLVYFPLLVELCRRHGLIFDYYATFADFYKDQMPRNLGLLKIMRALEPMDALIDDLNNADYAHVENFFKNSGCQQCSTLSMSEWEVINLYTVCVFRKCKTVLDHEGKPMYILK